MAKYQRILSYFPAFYRSGDPYKLLHYVVERLAQPVEEADTHLFRIQRSHRVNVAEHVEDIMRLAAVLNLTPYEFEDILQDPGFDYDLKLNIMRSRVKRIAAVHLDGLGTPWAVMEAAAVFLNAEMLPADIPADIPASKKSASKTTPTTPTTKKNARKIFISHLDSERFSHKARVKFTHVPQTPTGSIYLFENPLRRKKIPFADRYHMDSWTVNNKNVLASPVKIVIKGVGEGTVLPRVFCPRTREGILFNGIVPAGKMLIIDKANGAMMDNKPVDPWLIYYKGGLFGFGNMDHPDDMFAVEEGNVTEPFNGNAANLIAAPYKKTKTVPAAPVGKSQWHFSIEEGVFDRSLFGFSVQAVHTGPIGKFDSNTDFDKCLFDYPAAAVAGMAWDERIPCAFKLLLPAHIPAAAKEEQPQAETGQETKPGNIVSRLGNIIPRFKAAGIHAYVDKATDGWVLGDCVIRDGNADSGEGIDQRPTALYGKNTDRFVEFAVENGGTVEPK